MWTWDDEYMVKTLVFMFICGLNHYWERCSSLDLGFSPINEQSIEIALGVNIHNYRTLNVIISIVGVRECPRIDMINIAICVREKHVDEDMWLYLSFISSHALLGKYVLSRLSNLNLGKLFSNVKNRNNLLTIKILMRSKFELLKLKLFMNLKLKIITTVERR